MFTGIIEEVGTFLSKKSGSCSASVTIAASRILESVHLGDSICVNGVCLTVTSFHSDSFTADSMPEIMRRIILGRLPNGSPVNLERAMALGGRFGGHIITGHIDGTGVIQSVRREDNAIWYTIRTSPDILRYIIPKGSVAIDGISLTVAEVNDACFRISMIPHTALSTALSQKRTGDTVNLENDCVGKYVEKLLGISREQPRSVWESLKN